MIRRLEELDISGKRVFVRADFNVPVRKGRITETHRIESTLPTLRFLLAKAGKLLIASHLGRPGGKKDPEWSLAPVRDHLEQALSCAVTLAPDCIGSEVEALARDPTHKVILLENLRFHKEEEANDPAFSQALASLADVYVNDAFGAAHRAHASTAGMAKFFREKGAGILLYKELDYLGRILSSPERPFVAILGGAKVSDKIGVLKNLIPKMDRLLIGGGMAYTFLKAKGVEVGRSLIEEERVALARDLVNQAESLGIPLFLPIDHIAAEETKKNPITVDGGIPPNLLGLDIGPKTISQFIQEIRKARMILWNGPVGLFEEEKFSQGTRSVARALAEHDAISIVAGGDTVAAVMQAGVENKITHLSTGGGATLEFLEGKGLPGILALEEKQ
ncbi:MAG: phosphoglycerate kinase [Deltaproteobacteria bacterium RBG_16_55_12]|nr:MAG: phosphoglycerate kinase [Deltaproteobacteria bacterium GWD2_55_8]OGP96831.1 MAG: phosphoglycerate kinase [Deltaproteobacteria bacterium RBG_16_55_12]OGQ90660.1 MAG: phosphoglycerate kinase [Deltaproteobacteria bacterium RIFOXYA2_FULL_55_11]